jgi:beta-glucosidase
MKQIQMRNKIKYTLIILFSTILLCYSKEVFSQEIPLFRNQNVSQHERILNLLSQLTVEEKVGLLIETSPAIPRLGIEKYYHGNEALHGIVRPGKFTVFPQAIGLASMWNPELQNQIATIISDEARARWNELSRGKKQTAQFSDLLTFWSPTINMARDPRWGRTPETYGEDPFLAGILAVQFVKGLQGNDSNYLKVVSTPKHFAANNEEHNRFECNAIIPIRSLREYYLPAFEAAIKDGKAQSIMTSYNAINDIPSTANPWLLTKVLRDEWGFKGYIVSDCGAPTNLVTHHKYVKTKELAAMISIKAGLDLECGSDVYKQPLLNAFKEGMVSIVEIDSAAYHVLRARMKLGLFDDPEKNPYNKLDPSIVGSAEHKLLALEAARQSMVLLKNQKNILPINRKKIKTIAIVGINAGNAEFGGYSGVPVGEPVSILKGIQDKVGKDIKVEYAPWHVITKLEGYQPILKDFFPQGLQGAYFSNSNLLGTPKVRTDLTINFEPQNQAPDPFLPNPPMSIRWTGKIRPNISGRYGIAFSSDDGCRLSINGINLIDSWIKRRVKTDFAEFEFEAGKEYDLKAEYFNASGDGTAKIFWKIPNNGKPGEDLYADAKEKAKHADLTIAVLGINESIEGEGLDRNTLNLPKDQESFIQQIYQANHNTIVVLVAGSSMAIKWINDSIPGIIDAWYPGEQGGKAVADVLFGDYNPAGRLPLTFYNTMDDLPAFDDYDITKGRTYQYFKGKPLYPFGFGLSYTSFEYKDLQLTKTENMINVIFNLKNSGKMDGDEVVQVYVKLPESGIILPIKQLKGFKRVHLENGKTEKVEIAIDKAQLRYWDEKASTFITPKGTYTIMVGASSSNIKLNQQIVL